MSIRIVRDLECCLEVDMLSSVRILHQYMRRDTIKLQVILYTFVQSDEYGHKVMHDEELNGEQKYC